MHFTGPPMPNHYIPPNNFYIPNYYIPSPPMPQFTGSPLLPSLPISQPFQYPPMTSAQFQIQMNAMAAALQQQYHAAALMYSGTLVTPYPPLSIPPGQYPAAPHRKRWREPKTGAPQHNPNLHASRMITNGDHAIPHHKRVGGAKNARRDLSGPPSGMSTAMPRQGHNPKKRKEEKRGYRISDNLRQYVVAKDADHSWKKPRLDVGPTTTTVASTSSVAASTPLTS